MTRAQKHPHGKNPDPVRQELVELRAALNSAYRIFNSSSDPSIVEASILEISALQTRYGRMLRDLKNTSEV